MGRRAVDQNVVVPIDDARASLSRRPSRAIALKSSTRQPRARALSGADVDSSSRLRDDRPEGDVESMRTSAMLRSTVLRSIRGRRSSWPADRGRCRDFVTERRERAAEIDGARGLADAPFLEAIAMDVTHRALLLRTPLPGPASSLLCSPQRAETYAPPARTDYNGSGAFFVGLPLALGPPGPLRGRSQAAARRYLGRRRACSRRSRAVVGRLRERARAAALLGP